MVEGDSIMVVAHGHSVEVLRALAEVLGLGSTEGSEDILEGQLDATRIMLAGVEAAVLLREREGGPLRRIG